MPYENNNLVGKIIFANIVVFILSMIFGDIIFNSFALFTNTDILSLDAYRLITYTFVHAGFFHILFNMLFLYPLGSEIEEVFGTDIFAITYFVSGIVGGLAGIFSTGPLSAAIVGASAAVSGILAFYAYYFPRRRFIFFIFGVIPVPMTMARFIVVWITVQIIGAIGSVGNIGWVPHLAGFFTGLVIAITYKRLARPTIYHIE